LRSELKKDLSIGETLKNPINSKEIEENYLSFDDDTLWGHVTGSFRIVKAIIRK
jgi:hypothetical protein